MIVSANFGSGWITCRSPRPTEAALHALADKLIAAGVDTKGVEIYAPTGKRYVVFRDPDNIQLEYWLGERVGGQNEGE